MNTSSAYLYSVFGLIIASDIELRELNAAPPGAIKDVEIVTRPFREGLPDIGQGPLFDYCAAGGVEMIWPGVAGFLIVGTHRIEVMPYPDVSNHFLAFPILGPVFGWLLAQRGQLVMHASGIMVRGQCVAFLGDKMAGKSTTAAAFLRRGAKLVTDDLLVINMTRAADPIVYPAFAQLKLAEDAANEIAVPGANPLPLVLEGFPKRQHRLADMHCAETQLGRVYVLQRGGVLPSIEPLAPSDGMLALMRFSYSVRFANAPQNPIQRARHFRQCVTLAGQPGVSILHIPANLGALDLVVDTVLRDLQSEQTDA